MSATSPEGAEGLGPKALAEAYAALCGHMGLPLPDSREAVVEHCVGAAALGKVAERVLLGTGGVPLERWVWN